MAESGSDSTICRICMIGKAYLIPIVDIHDTNEPTLHEMISECTRYKVELNDLLPKKVCLECAGDVRTAYRLKNRAEESYRKLCTLYHKQVNQSVVEKETQTEKHIYSCELCLLKFSDPSDLQLHRKTEHQGVERKCRFCHKSFDLLRQLKSHLIQEHPDEYVATNLQCQICERKFSREDHLHRHIRHIHRTDVKYISNCPAQDATIETNLQCHICEKEFSRKDHLQRHIRNVHRTDLKYFSNYLAPDATIEQAIDCLDVIIKTDEKDENNCLTKYPVMGGSDAEVENVNVINLDVVSYKNIKEQPENDGTDRKTRSAESPKKLALKVELPNYESENIDYEPENTASFGLNQYFENYDSEELLMPQLKISKVVSLSSKVPSKRGRKNDSTKNIKLCNICQRIFSSHSHMKRHILSVHSNEKPYACPHCDRSFSRSDYLQKHASVHGI